MQRVRDTELNIDSTIEDIIREFPKVKEEQILKAIKNGGLGMYGQTYKLTTQVFCVWIRAYLKDPKKVIKYENAYEKLGQIETKKLK